MIAPMLTVRDIAADLQLTTTTVSQKLHDGVIPGGTKALGAWRVNPETYAAWKDALTNPPPRDPHLVTPMSPRSRAAKKAADTRNQRRTRV